MSGGCASAGPRPSARDVYKRQELHRAVEEHLAEMERRGAVSRENFKKLRFDMLQLLFSKLYSRQIEARRLFSSEQNDLLYARSLRSVAGTVSYTHLDVYKRQIPGGYRDLSQPLGGAQKL